MAAGSQAGAGVNESPFGGGRESVDLHPGHVSG